MLQPPLKKRVVVAGGAGFLGTHLCERLLSQGRRVLCVDNFHTGRQQNLLHLRGDERFSVLSHDITEPLEVEVDAIFNMACPASPAHYQAKPIQTLTTCLQGSLNLLELARRQRIPIFQASTSEIYGDPQLHPQPEDYRGYVNCIGPRACYNEGKRSAEALFFHHRHQYGTAIKVGRIFNTYGPYMRADDGRVVSNFIVQALRNQPITIYGDGSQTRSFCYVSDMIEAILRFMETPDACTGPLNLGNPAEITVAELAERIIELTGSRSRIIHQSLPVDDPIRRCPDISRASAALGWQPVVALEQGLKETIAYFERQVRRAGRSWPKAVGGA